MNKQEYMKELNNEPDKIVVTRDDVKEYVKTIADAANALKEAMYELDYGKLIDGKYQRQITPIDARMNINGNMEVLMYDGIELMAQALDRLLEKEKRDSKEYPYAYILNYFGVRFFQLVKADQKENA